MMAEQGCALPTGVFGERDQRRCHLHRARTSQDCDCFWRGLRLEEAGTYLVRIRRLSALLLPFYQQQWCYFNTTSLGITLHTSFTSAASTHRWKMGIKLRSVYECQIDTMMCSIMLGKLHTSETKLCAFDCLASLCKCFWNANPFSRQLPDDRKALNQAVLTSFCWRQTTLVLFCKLHSYKRWATYIDRRHMHIHVTILIVWWALQWG